MGSEMCIRDRFRQRGGQRDRHASASELINVAGTVITPMPVALSAPLPKLHLYAYPAPKCEPCTVTSVAPATGPLVGENVDLSLIHI